MSGELKINKYIEDMNIEIKDDKKEKYQSWELKINIILRYFSNDYNPSYLGGGHYIDNDLNISMYDGNYNDLKCNSIKELERMLNDGVISEYILEKVKNKFCEYEKGDDNID